MLPVTLAAAVVAGLVMGLLGGGGSILTLPILVYLAGLPTQSAIASSLVVVAVSSTVALVPHARAGRVRWRTAAPFAVTGVAGAYAGGRLAALLPDTVLLVGFGLMMLAAAVAMLRPRPSAPARVRPAPLWRPAALGGAVGLLTGLVGAGGGFVIVPVLALVAGLPMAEAVGTSLLIIAVQSAAGLAGHLHGTPMNWPLTAAVTAAAVVGSLVGAQVVARVPQAGLRRAFGWLVVSMAALILVQQVPAAAWHAVAADPALPLVAVGVLAAACAVAFAVRARRGAQPGTREEERPRIPVG